MSDDRGGGSVEDLPPEIVPGAIVNVTGTVTEFMGLTEITNPTVTFVSAPVDAPSPAATDIGTLADPIDGEAYEGVYVTLTNVKVTAATATPPNDFYFTIAQGTDTIIVDDEPLGRSRIASLLEDEDDIEIVAQCVDGV